MLLSVFWYFDEIQEDFPLLGGVRRFGLVFLNQGGETLIGEEGSWLRVKRNSWFWRGKNMEEEDAQVWMQADSVPSVFLEL